MLIDDDDDDDDVTAGIILYEGLCKKTKRRI